MGTQGRPIMLRRASVLLGTLAMGSAFAHADLQIEAVSNRADLVSGGDVLLRVTLPAKVSVSQATLSLNGRALPGALHAAPDGRGYLALVTGLVQGDNTVSVSTPKAKAHLDVTNHP